MTVLSKPIPALYTVYVLRSTVRHASLYIGSTPNPPRRLKQHNGQARGGAARTSRASLRPWEMVALVSGFPGMVAALKFEWALDNPHLSLHIPSSSRITVATQKKRNGAPRRPAHSLTSIVSNLHLLLRVPSFARWPLRLHFFAPEVHAAWEKWSAGAAERLRADLPVLTDFGPHATVGPLAGSKKRAVGKSTAAAKRTTTAAEQIRDDGEDGTLGPSNAATAGRPWGIHALPLGYDSLRPYIAKADEIFRFEREGSCAVCRQALAPGKGLYAVCPNGPCEAVGHVACWGNHLLKAEGQQRDKEEGGAVIPVQGTCPQCQGTVHWGDMMTELSLRVRGPKEVEKLLSKKKKRAAGLVEEEEDDDDDDDDDD